MCIRDREKTARIVSSRGVPEIVLAIITERDVRENVRITVSRGITGNVPTTVLEAETKEGQEIPEENRAESLTHQIWSL